MPYKIVMENQKHCIYKHSPQGEIIGDSLGCHDTQLQAEKQLVALYAQEGRFYPFVLNSIKGELSGYIAVWGSRDRRDSYGTWFDKESPPDMALDFLPRPVMYEHGFDDQIGREILGQVTKISFDDFGIRFEGELLKSSPFYDRVVTEINQGLLKTSSATSEHTASFDSEGRFVNWALLEVSLTKTPAEELMPIVTVRSFSPNPGQNSVQEGSTEGRDASETADAQLQGDKRMTLQELLAQMASGQEVPPEQLIAALIQEYGADAVEAVLQQMAATPSESPEQQPAAANSVIANVLSALSVQRTAATRERQTAPPANPPPVVAPVRFADQPQTPRNPRISVGSRYQHLTPDEMALGYMLMRSATKKSGAPPVSNEYLRAMAAKTAQAISKEDAAASDYAVRSKFPFKSLDDVMQSDPLAAIRAGEIHTGGAGQGDEWVYDLQGTGLWQNVRSEALVYKACLSKGMEEVEIPAGFDGESLPLEGSDPTFYVAPGSSDVDASSGMPTPTFNTSKFGTGKKAISVSKLSAAMDFRRELEEDSVIQIVQEARRKLTVRATEVIDEILMNGDTDLSANTNINKIDGTPTAAPAQPSYTLLDGFLKLALVTNTANKRDAGASFDETDFLETYKLMPSANRQNRQKLLYVLDSDTAVAASNIPTLKTRDVYSAATLEEGVLTKIWRIDVLETGFMALANSAGKISVTGSNNTLGRLLLVRPDQWATRWKRRLQLDVTYFSYPDVTQVVAHMRWGLAYRDNEAAAVSYNINVALS